MYQPIMITSYTYLLIFLSIFFKCRSIKNKKISQTMNIYYLVSSTTLNF